MKYSICLNRHVFVMSSNMAYILIVFAEKICKSYSHFFSKNTCELDVVHILTRTVNNLTTNELVVLTTL